MASARAVDNVGIASAGKAVIRGLGSRRVGEQTGLRIDASGSVEHNVPAICELFLAPDAKTRLLQVVRCDEESVLIAVSVYQRRAFVVIAVFRQTVTDPADADVIGAI